MVMKVLLTDVSLDSLTSESSCSFFIPKVSLLEQTIRGKLENTKSFRHDTQLQILIQSEYRQMLIKYET